MRLSIVVSVYNEACVVEKCMKRVASVNLPENLEWEIIVVDDGSADGSGTIVKTVSRFV